MKATALLKLIYLEMFGHDMSWASFHVLEVMSCAKYQQKRVGYLAAVQSFRPDTEVLMLATNLLKKVWKLACFFRPSLAQETTGHIITVTPNYLSAPGYTSSHYYLLFGTFSSIRSLAKASTLESQHTEEDCRCPLQACVSLPRYFAIGLAENKGYPDG